MQNGAGNVGRQIAEPQKHAEIVPRMPLLVRQLFDAPSATGLQRTLAAMLAAICAICFFGWVRALRRSGFSKAGLSNSNTRSTILLLQAGCELCQC